MNELVELTEYFNEADTFRNYNDNHTHTIVSFFNSNGVDGMITFHFEDGMGRVNVWNAQAWNPDLGIISYKRVKVSTFTLADILHNHMVNQVATLEVER